MPTVEDLRIEPPPAPPRRRPGPWGLLLLVPAFAAAAWLASRLLLPGAAAPPTPPGRAQGTADPAPTPAAAQDPAGSFTAGGYLELVPPGALVVSAAVEGRVASLRVVEGDRVEAGQELAVLDEAPHRMELQAREAAVELARARLEQLLAGFRPEEIARAEAALDAGRALAQQAEAEAARAERLHALGGGSLRAVEEARAGAATARAEVRSREADLALRRQGPRPQDVAVARAELAAAEAERARAHWKLEACTVRAPASGVVLERFAGPGDWVAPSGGGPRPAALLSLADPRRLQAWVDVPQRMLARVAEGQRVHLATESHPRRRISGTVAALMPRAHLERHSVQAKIRIEDPPADLRPDMSVQVTFLPLDQDR